jgi:uncharacterized protein (DUF885 family)
MGQFAGGTGAQPLNRARLHHFLKRMDKYSVWIDSAMVYMKKGMAKEGSITKSIDGKTNSLQQMATPKIEDNLFYSAIKLMPDSFPESIKRFNSQVYGHHQRQTDSSIKKWLIS